jgi:hypothetical protein
MKPSEFAAFYERYREQCISAGVKPLTPEVMQDRIAQWDSMGLSWDNEPQNAGLDGDQPQHPMH